jgi:hypothetical protein
MAYLSKLQVKEILDKAPPNLDKGKIIESLVSQGNELEGFNEQVKTESLISRATKGVVKAVANPLLRLGATADALGSSKYLGGTGTNNTVKKTPLGDVKPITTVKDAAGVGAELAATGLGLKGLGTAGRFGAKFLGSAVVGGLSGAGQKLQQAESTAKDVIKSAGVGAAIGGALPVAGEAFGLAKRFLGVAAKGAASSLSGAGSDAVQAVIDNPRAARAGLRGNATETIKDLSTTVRSQVSNLAKEAQAEYSSSLEKLKNPGTLTTKGAKQTLSTIFDRFDVKVTKKGLDFTKSPFIGGEEQTLQRVYDVVNNWSDTTPQGINKLAIKIGQFRKSGVTNPELNSVIDAAKKGVRSYLGEQVPEAKLLNTQYAKMQDFIQAIDQELSTNGKFTGGTTEQINTAKKISTIFNKNKDLARELVERLEGGSEILGKEAGRELSSGVSRSTASIGDLTRGVIQTIIPPRAIGEIAAATGIAQENLAPILAGLKTLKPAERTVLLQLLNQAINGDDSQSDELSTDSSFPKETPLQ